MLGKDPLDLFRLLEKAWEKLSTVFVDYAKENIEGVTAETLQKYKEAPFRAPMIIILISEIKTHPKVPEIEQMLSTAAGCGKYIACLKCS